MTAASRVIRAYHRHYPLTEAEQRALFPLVLSRLGMSVCYSAHNRARNPGDAYQVVSEAAAWDLLDKLEFVVRKRCAGIDSHGLRGAGFRLRPRGSCPGCQ